MRVSTTATSDKSMQKLPAVKIDAVSQREKFLGEKKLRKPINIDGDIIFFSNYWKFQLFWIRAYPFSPTIYIFSFRLIAMSYFPYYIIWK